MSMSAGQKQTEKTKRKRQQPDKPEDLENITERLDRAIKDAQDLFPSKKVKRNRKISHFEMDRDSEGRRIYHCHRKESKTKRSVGEAFVLNPDQHDSDMPSHLSPTATDNAEEEHQYIKKINYEVWIGSLVTLFSCILSPLTIFLSQRHGIRVTQFIGGLLLTLGVVSTSLVNSINYMFLTYGIVVGIGSALVFTPALAVIPELFDKHVSIATGIGCSGTTLGLIFFSIVLPTLLEALGWRKTMWIIAALGPLISVCGFAFPKPTVTPTSSVTTDEKQIEKGLDDIYNDKSNPWWKSIKKKAFILWTITSFTVGLIEFVPLFLVALCATESGIPASQTKWLNIIYGFGCFFGKIISGSLAQPLLKRDKSKYIYLGTLFAFSVSSFLVSLNTGFQWLVLYMVVVGFLQGVNGSMFYIVTLEIVGVAAYPAVCGFLFSVLGVSMTTGPPLAGLLYENLPHVRYLLLAISATSFFATIFMAILPCVTPRRTYTLHQGCYDYWRVYCHNPNISPRPVRQTRTFTIKDAARKLQAEHKECKPCGLTKHGPPRTVSQTRLVTAEELQIV